MNSLIQPIAQHFQNGSWPVLLLDSSLKGFVLLTLAGMCCLFWRKASAAAKHLVWFVGILGVLCFPLVSSLAPAWQRPWWTVGARVEPGNQIAVVVAVAPSVPSPKSQKANSPGTARVGVEARASRSVLGQTAEFKLPWLGAAIAMWATGLAAVLGLMCHDQFRLKALSHKAELVSNPEWRSLQQELVRKLDLRRRVRLLQSDKNPMPVTWGSFRPIILLPEQAKQWPVERRRVVLLHELAHVKRWDSLSQFIARVACGIYWFNPWVWIAARQMCIERERACDDLVLGGGIKASEYAGHLVEIARGFACTPRLPGVAMARSSQLKQRVCSIVGAHRSRRLSRATALTVLLALGAAVMAIGGNQAAAPESLEGGAQVMLERQLAQLRAFSEAKLKQSQGLAAATGTQISPEFQRFFNAAVSGDSQTVTNMYEDFKRRHPQYAHGWDESLSTPYWSPVLEICLAYDHVVRCTPKYTALLADGIINSIPAGSIYFGGTDPGRGVPTAFEKSQIDANPFFILTQNALANGDYLQYLRQTYDGKLSIPSDKDSQQCFDNYLADALRRLKHDQQFPNEPKQIRPGENVHMENGKGQVSGQVAVMAINGLLSKRIFDQNPGHEFYIEESFPLDWMYSHLEPHGLIMKIDRESPTTLASETVARDDEYWHSLVAGMLGDWLDANTPIKTVTDFVQKVHVQHDFSGFSGDPSFVQNDYAKRIFSKLRSSIAGLYEWRTAHAANSSDAQRMAAEADLAFRQAFALCPYSPEAVFRYTTFLSQHNRTDDALAIASSAAAVDPKNSEFQNLIHRLKDTQ